MVLIVGVPDNLGVGGEELGCCCPIRLEAGNVGDDFVIVAAYFVESIFNGIVETVAD